MLQLTLEINLSGILIVRISCVRRWLVRSPVYKQNHILAGLCNAAPQIEIYQMLPIPIPA